MMQVVTGKWPAFVSVRARAGIKSKRRRITDQMRRRAAVGWGGGKLQATLTHQSQADAQASGKVDLSHEKTFRNRFGRRVPRRYRRRLHVVEESEERCATR